MANRKLIEAGEDYLAWRAKRPKSGSMSTATSVIRRFCRAWDETRRSPRNLTPIWIEDWLSDLGVLPSSLATYESILAGFLGWCEKRDVVGRRWEWDRLGDSSSGRPKPFLYLPASFFQTVIEAQDNWYYRGLMAGLVWTLGRGVELRQRQVKDVRLSAGLIHWPRTKTGDYDDFLPVSDDLRAELERYLTAYRREVGELEDSYYLFPRIKISGRHSTMTVYPTEQRWRLERTVKRLIVPHLEEQLIESDPDLLVGEGAHTIRRSMARNWYEWLLANGHADPLGIVQAMLGHKNRSMTERYIGLASERQRRNAVIRGASFFAAGQASVVDMPTSIERRADDAGAGAA